MAVGALRKPGHPGITSVFTEDVAAFTSVINRFDMKSMVKVDRLPFLGVKKLRENNPSDYETCNKPNDEEQDNKPAGAFSLLFFIDSLKRCYEPLRRPRLQKLLWFYHLVYSWILRQAVVNKFTETAETNHI